MTSRSYGQYCGLARALDVVSSRWSLLIVRELLGGPARYAQLQAGLPGISIPCGLSEGLPVGLQLIGAPWSEASLMALARGYEGITGIVTCTELGDCATDVTIGIFQYPNWPVEGGEDPDTPVYTDTKTLADVL